MLRRNLQDVSAAAAWHEKGVVVMVLPVMTMMTMMVLMRITMPLHTHGDDGDVGDDDVASEFSRLEDGEEGRFFRSP